ncbi:ABC transporter permease [Spirochaeta lutea]|uniref:Transport permease protein n=1 Tax=Spirochaeta lutea TaxID=1480694 RepID=A0A098QTP9_9SPIO|nr:ABC transporter permease [Spirochaeta lutea]KGE70941.1 ABC transporter [Spirochaeta lutea]
MSREPHALDALLTLQERPPAPNWFAACLALGWRALLKIKHVPEQLFDVTAFPIMMTLLFSLLFGGALAGSVESYVQFLIPGILVMTVVMITMYTALTINKDIAKGLFDRLQTLPIWQPSALVGALLGDLVRYTIASVVVLVLGLILGFRPEGGLLGLAGGVGVVLVFAFSLSWIWTMMGLLLKTPEAVMSISSIVSFPLTFGSNIFVDPGTMPGWLQVFVRVNPVTHATTAARSVIQGSPDLPALGITLIWSVVLVLVFGAITMYLYRTRNNR